MTVVRWLVASAALAGCAAFRCEPSTIVVADTLRDERLGSRVDSVRVDPVTGRVYEVRHNVVEESYWVRETDGRWIAVDEATWRRAEKGRPLRVCR